VSTNIDTEQITNGNLKKETAPLILYTIKLIWVLTKSAY
jgi:hypothetical protein